MTLRNEIKDEYFDWLFDIVHEDRFIDPYSFTTLLKHLHNIEFTYSRRHSDDANRAEAGRDLRYRFAWLEGYSDVYEDVLDILGGPCSVLEMMVAVAIKCEETMDDPSIGDRTGQWFWGMIVNLGLGSMNDLKFDQDKVDDIIARFLNREYEPNGKGGLFSLKHSDIDLRNVSIWRQMCWYLDECIF